MGLDYSFILVAERSRIDSLLRAVAERLIPENRERLLTCVPYDVNAGLTKARSTDLEQELGKRGIDQLCLSFLIPFDPHVTEYAQRLPRQTVNGKFPVGCVWCSVRCEERFVAVHAMAATSSMSRLFEQSAKMQSTFAEIARDGGAKLLLFDDEQATQSVLWPSHGRIELNDITQPFSGNDRYYAAVLEEAETFGRSTLI